VAEALDLPDLSLDPRFKRQVDRARNQDQLREILESRFALRAAREWIDEMDRRGVPCAPINSYSQILADPHVVHMGLVHPLRLPNGVETRTTGFPVKLSGHDFAILRQPPRLGAHTDEVVEQWIGQTVS
jgi:crotonobetainyl-CoA:carnitine CoA-transferase CaiB-like acyl-CoA transferase